MRIVFLSHVDFNLYLFRLPIMKAMAASGWEVYALCPKGDYSDRFQKDGIIHVDYGIERGSLNPIKEFRTIRNIAEKLREISPDVLHTFTVKPNIYGNIAARLAGTRIVISSVTGLGSFFIEKGAKALLIRTLISTLYRFIFRWSTAVIFQNRDDMRLFIGKNIVSREKTHLIKGSGIDTGLWQKTDRDAGEVKKVLFVGRLLVHKGIKEFIDAAREVKKHHHEAEFTIAGDYDPGNPYNLPREIMEKAVAEGIVRFVGWQESVKPLFKTNDIFVLPSYREGMPRTAIEAASMSMPVITTDAVGCREVVDDGVNGYLVPVGESRSLAQKISQLMENRELYEKMAENARKKALAEFDIKSIVLEHQKLYTACLEEL